MALGQYVTVEGLEARLGLFDPPTETADLLQDVCDEVNDLIENECERVVGPYPTWSDSTVSGTAGARTLTGVTTTGLRAGDRLIVGLLSGTHEAVTVLGTAATTVTLRAPLAHSYTNAPAQRIAVVDGIRSTGKVLRYFPGLVSLAAVEFSDGTQPSEWRLDPVTPPPGRPHSAVRLLNGDTFPAGYDDVYLIGPGPVVGMSDATGFGFPATPAAIEAVAYNLAAGRWQMRQSGGSYEIAPGTDQVQVGLFMLTRLDYMTLKGFGPKWAIS